MRAGGPLGQHVLFWPVAVHRLGVDDLEGRYLLDAEASSDLFVFVDVNLGATDAGGQSTRMSARAQRGAARTGSGSSAVRVQWRGAELAPHL